MKYLKLYENFSEESLNEDFLELKSISKQLYSLLKKNGYEVEIIENSKKSTFHGGDHLVGTKDSKHLNGKGGTAQIVQFSDVEQIGVFMPIYAVVHQFIIAPENKEIIKQMVDKKKPGDYEKYPGTYQKSDDKQVSQISDTIFGESGKSARQYDMQKNPEVLKFVQKLGAKLLDVFKSKYPKMLLKFEDQETSFVLYFAEPTTKKGAVINPNQKPNKPKKEIQEKPE